MFIGDYSTMAPTESEYLSIDFVNDLPTGDSIASVSSVTLSVVSGTDLTPNSHLVGSPGVSGTTVSQKVSGLLDTVTYCFTVTIATSNSLTISNWAHILCQSNTYPAQ